MAMLMQPALVMPKVSKTPMLPLMSMGTVLASMLMLMLTTMTMTPASELKEAPKEAVSAMAAILAACVYLCDLSLPDWTQMAW